MQLHTRQNIVRYCRELANADSEAGIRDLMAIFVGYLDVPYYSYLASLPTTEPGETPREIILTNLPETMMAQYSQYRWFESDYAANQCLEQSRSLCWHWLDYPKNARSKAVVRLAADYGIRNGIYVPTYGGPVNITGVFGVFVKQRDARSRRHLETILPDVHHLAQTLHPVVTAVKAPELAAYNQIQFTQIEKDLLIYLQAGLKRTDIANRLTIAVTTMDKHIRALLDKLQVNNVNELLARAGKLGLLDPHRLHNETNTLPRRRKGRPKEVAAKPREA